VLRPFLDTDRPIYAVETQGLGRDRRALHTIEEMAASYLEGVLRVQPHGPIHLVGYSFGGVIALEMAQQLAAANYEVGLVGFIDTFEWSYTRRVLKSYTLSEKFHRIYKETLKRAIFGPNRTEALLQRIERARNFLEATLNRVLNRPQSAVSAGTAEHRNYHALSAYRPRNYNGTIHLFRCDDNSILRGSDPTLGWAPFCSSIVSVPIPGEHGSLLELPTVAHLGRAVQDALESSDAVLRRTGANSRPTQTLAVSA
jgi:thioesterase domain-containing protein